MKLARKENGGNSKELSYDSLTKEVTDILDKNKVWVLATSAGNRVTARSVNIVNDGLMLYFQTETLQDKYRQITENPQVALCFFNVQVEGMAESIGHVASDSNEAIRINYCRFHNNAYERWRYLDEQVFIAVRPTFVTMWKVVNGKPCRDFLDVASGKAIREYYHPEAYD